MENVPCVPDCAVPGYKVQRIDLDARECGSEQRRARHFQFGSREGMQISVVRGPVTGLGLPPVLASDGKRGGGDWPAAVRLQGLPEGFALPSFTRKGKFRAVGNGVPVPMSRALAVAIRARQPWFAARLCGCGCGRTVTGNQALATGACRKREQRRRDAAGVTPRAITQDLPVAG